MSGLKIDSSNISGSGYAKLKDVKLKEKAPNKEISESATEAKDRQKSNPTETESKPEATTKTASKSHDLLVETARLMKRAVGSASDRYKQFIDVECDDGERGMMEGTYDVHAEADCSSDGQDMVHAGEYQIKKDYDYKELEDQFGSKKLTKLRTIQEMRSGANNSGSNLFVTKSAIRPNVESNMDRIVGHEHGDRSLLEYDELSDSETDRTHSNPFVGADVKEVPSKVPAPAVVPATISPLFQPGFDVFGAAPFRKKSVHQKKVQPARVEAGSEAMADQSKSTYQQPKGDSNLFLGRPDEKNSKNLFMSNPHDQEMNSEQRHGKLGNQSTMTTPLIQGQSSAGKKSSSPFVSVASAMPSFSRDSEDSKSKKEAPSKFMTSDYMILSSKPDAPSGHSSTAFSHSKVIPSAVLPADKNHPNFDSAHHMFHSSSEMGETSMICKLDSSPGTRRSKMLISGGDDGSSSPQTGKKDKYQIDGDANSPLNDDVTGITKFSRIHRKNAKDKPAISEFANLGFTDDPDGLRQDESQNSLGKLTINEVSLDGDDEAGCLVEDNHTLPRTGPKKHRVLPAMPDIEPFLLKKKSTFV